MKYLLLYKLRTAKGDLVNEWELFDTDTAAHLRLNRLRTECQPSWQMLSSKQLLSICLLEVKEIPTP